MPEVKGTDIQFKLDGKVVVLMMMSYTPVGL